MTEQGAVPDNGIAVEPREAQRPTSLAARTPQAAIPGNGDIAVGAQAGLASLPQGCRSAAPEAPPGAPSPHIEGRRKKGMRATPGPKNKEQWQRSVV